jgi:hypothetical protein
MQRHLNCPIQLKQSWQPAPLNLELLLEHSLSIRQLFRPQLMLWGYHHHSCWPSNVSSDSSFSSKSRVFTSGPAVNGQVNALQTLYDLSIKRCLPLCTKPLARLDGGMMYRLPSQALLVLQRRKEQDPVDPRGRGSLAQYSAKLRRSLQMLRQPCGLRTDAPK